MLQIAKKISDLSLVNIVWNIFFGLATALLIVWFIFFFWFIFLSTMDPPMDSGNWGLGIYGGISMFVVPAYLGLFLIHRFVSKRRTAPVIQGLEITKLESTARSIWKYFIVFVLLTMSVPTVLMIFTIINMISLGKWWK